MNVHTTNGIRELTAQELDQVTGGVVIETLVISYMASCMLLGVASFIDWLLS